jgi:hypothetical protein
MRLRIFEDAKIFRCMSCVPHQHQAEPALGRNICGDALRQCFMLSCRSVSLRRRRGI